MGGRNYYDLQARPPHPVTAFNITLSAQRLTNSIILTLTDCHSRWN